MEPIELIALIPHLRLEGLLVRNFAQAATRAPAPDGVLLRLDRDHRGPPKSRASPPRGARRRLKWVADRASSGCYCRSRCGSRRASSRTGAHRRRTRPARAARARLRALRAECRSADSRDRRTRATPRRSWRAPRRWASTGPRAEARPSRQRGYLTRRRGPPIPRPARRRHERRARRLRRCASAEARRRGRHGRTWRRAFAYVESRNDATTAANL